MANFRALETRPHLVPQNLRQDSVCTANFELFGASIYEHLRVSVFHLYSQD